MTVMPLDPVLAIATMARSDGSEILIAARESGLHTSPDRGLTWTPRWTDGLAATLGVVSDPEGNRVILAGISGGVFRSDDGGESWTPRLFSQPPPLVSSLTVLGDGVVLAATHQDGVFRSADGGSTWRSANLGLYLRKMTSLLVLGGRRALAATDCCVFETRNAADSWEELAGIEIDGHIVALAGDEQIVLLGATDGTIWVHNLQEQRTLGRVDIPAAGELLALGWRNREILAITEEAYHQVSVVVDNGEFHAIETALVLIPKPVTCGMIHQVGNHYQVMVGHADGSVTTY